MKHIINWAIAAVAVVALGVNELGCGSDVAKESQAESSPVDLGVPPIPPEPPEVYTDMTPHMVYNDDAANEHPSVRDLDFAVVMDGDGSLQVLVKDDDSDEVITLDERTERRDAYRAAHPVSELEKSTTCDNLATSPCDSVGLGLVGCRGMPDNRVVTYCGWDNPNDSLSRVQQGVADELTHLQSIAGGSFLVQQKFPSSTVNPGICAGYQPCVAAGVSTADTTCMLKFAPLASPTVTDLVFQNRVLNDGKEHTYCPGIFCPGSAACPTFKPGAQFLMCVQHKSVDQLDCPGCPGQKSWFNGCTTSNYTVDKGKIVTIDEAAVTKAMGSRGNVTTANKQLTCAAVGRSLGLDSYTTIAHSTILGVFDTTGESSLQPSCMSIVPPAIINNQVEFDPFTLDEIRNMVGPDAEGHPINRYAPPVFGTEE